MWPALQESATQAPFRPPGSAVALGDLRVDVFRTSYNQDFKVLLDLSLTFRLSQTKALSVLSTGTVRGSREAAQPQQKPRSDQDHHDAVLALLERLPASGRVSRSLACMPVARGDVHHPCVLGSYSKPTAFLHLAASGCKKSSAPCASAWRPRWATATTTALGSACCSKCSTRTRPDRSVDGDATFRNVERAWRGRILK